MFPPSVGPVLPAPLPALDGVLPDPGGCLGDLRPDFVPLLLAVAAADDMAAVVAGNM